MRKLPWHDHEVKDYVICCMINIWNVKYNSIHCVANLLAGLVLYQEDVGIHVVDGVLEDIRLGMEVKHFKKLLWLLKNKAEVYLNDIFLWFYVPIVDDDVSMEEKFKLGSK